MDVESTSEAIFNPGDLIWAKMKGFPPWPAKALERGEDTPPGRIPVFFFGTRERGFMKSSDLSDYFTNKVQYEIPRKHRGFNEGIHEIRVAAGLEAQSTVDPLFAVSNSRKSPSPILTQGRVRRSSGRVLADAFISGFERKRTNSASTMSRSRTSSTASALKHLKKAIKRRRLDSESSGGSRRNKMISGFSERFNTDFFDHFGQFNTLDGPDFNLLGDDIVGNEDARSTRSKRSRGSSKVFDDYILGGLSGRARHRSGSASEGRGTRSRLVSGVSDVFDELLYTATNELQIHSAAEQLMHTLDELPSESSEERPGTPEAPAPLPRPAQFCKECGCECQLYGVKWRCTSKYCLKWNGVAEPFDQPSTSTAIPITPSITLNGDTHRSGPLEMKEIPKVKIDSSEIADERQLSTIKAKKGLKREPLSPSLQKIKAKKEPLSPRKDRNKETQVREDERVTAGKDRRRVQVISPPPRNSQLSPKSPAPSSDGLITKRAQGRPKQYKVEKTPPIGVNGQRNCTFCNGQVRPQMCGGNKHRWRCVDKKCRKWYGWVRSNEEVPRDLGKKGRWKDAANRITKKAAITLPPQEPSSISSQGEAANAVAELDSASMSDVTLTSRSPLRTEIQPQIKKKLGRPPKQQGLKIRLKTAKDKKDENRTKRKYTKRKDKETMDILKNLTSSRREESPKPPLSPLTPRQMRYRPCAMEKRSRWWTSEKRRVDVSPDRDFQTGPADAAAAFRIMSHAFRAAAVTRADELGTVNGTLDLLMDSLLGSMAPLLSLLSRLPSMRAKPEVMQRLWNSSAIHLPMFQ